MFRSVGEDDGRSFRIVAGHAFHVMVGIAKRGPSQPQLDAFVFAADALTGLLDRIERGLGACSPSDGCGEGMPARKRQPAGDRQPSGRYVCSVDDLGLRQGEGARLVEQDGIRLRRAARGPLPN